MRTKQALQSCFTFPNRPTLQDVWRWRTQQQRRIAGLFPEPHRPINLLPHNHQPVVDWSEEFIRFGRDDAVSARDLVGGPSDCFPEAGDRHHFAVPSRNREETVRLTDRASMVVDRDRNDGAPVPKCGCEGRVRCHGLRPRHDRAQRVGRVLRIVRQQTPDQLIHGAFARLGFQRSTGPGLPPPCRLTSSVCCLASRCWLVSMVQTLGSRIIPTA